MKLNMILNRQMIKYASYYISETWLVKMMRQAESYAINRG